MKKTKLDELTDIANKLAKELAIEQRKLQKIDDDEIDEYADEILSGLPHGINQATETLVCSGSFYRMIMKTMKCGKSKACDVATYLMSQGRVGKKQVGRNMAYYSIPKELLEKDELLEKAQPKDDWFD